VACSVIQELPLVRERSWFSEAELRVRAHF
jgi:hypothetical protein